MGEGGKGQECRTSRVISRGKKFRFYSALEAIDGVSIIVAIPYIPFESSAADCTVLGI